MVVFGLSSLKFPQYFVLILLPAYCYLWTELARWELDPWWQDVLAVAAAVIGTMSFLLTVPAFNVNSLAQVQTLRGERIPASAIVVTEQTIGDLINQRWCTVEKAAPCLGHATYAITWQTYLQSSFDRGRRRLRQAHEGRHRRHVLQRRRRDRHGLEAKDHSMKIRSGSSLAATAAVGSLLRRAAPHAGAGVRAVR